MEVFCEALLMSFCKGVCVLSNLLTARSMGPCRPSLLPSFSDGGLILSKL